MRHVPDIAAVEIERLREDGVEPTDDEIVWLASLGTAVENPDGRTQEAAGLIDGLRLSDGTVLKPLTFYAEKWLGRVGGVFSGRMELAAVAYAMCCGDILDINRPLKRALSDVRAWIESLRVAPDELARAVSRMIGDDDRPARTSDAQAAGQCRETLIGLLVAGTGIPRESWERQPWVAVDRAHAGLLKYAAMIAGTEYDPEKEASKKALKNLGLAIIEIREKRNKTE